MKIVNVRYILNESHLTIDQRNKKESIYAEISGGFCKFVNDQKKYDKFQISLKAKILPIHFGKVNKTNNFIFDQTTFNKFAINNSNVKTKMTVLQTALNKVESYFTINDMEPTMGEFKKELLIQLKRNIRQAPRTFTIQEFLDKKITDFKENVGSSEKGKKEPNTIKSYITLSKYIQKYQTAKNTTLTFDNFDKAKYKDFWIVQDKILQGLITLPKLEGDRKQQIKANGFLVNGIIKYQKTFKAVLALAVKEKINIAIDLTDETLVLVETASVKDIYINETELQKIIDYVPTSEELKIAREYSIIASLTGMRNESMNDAYKAKIETFKDSEYNFSYIHSKHNKTKTECVIPLLKPIQDIVKANGNQFPKFPDNSTMNYQLKDLFFEAKINATETLTHNTFSKGIIIENKQVNEIISTHDFKGTFYSNLLNLKVNETQIDNITHPDKPTKNTMGKKYYDKRELIEKAKLFVDEVNKIKQSKVYTF